MHCAYGWEVVEVAPKLDYDFAGTDPRIAISETRESESRELAPELFAIHPMYAREAEEEIVFLADAFLSHVPESGAHLPNYRSWLEHTGLHAGLRLPAPDAAIPAVAEAPARGHRRPLGAEVAGAPGVPRRAAHQFPDLHVVHMHRDPRTTIASGASLNATLHAMHADEVDPHRVGAQWLERMGWTNDRAMAVRDSWADESARVTDIEFDDAVADPIGQVARRLRRDRGAADGRRGHRDEPTGWPQRPREVRAAAVRPGRLRPDRAARSTNDSPLYNKRFRRDPQEDR